MFDLVEAGQNTYYIDFPSKIGIYRQGEDVYLIDSGNDSKIARRVLKIINERGWSLRAVFNTHCHADHIGGSAYLQENTGCKVYVPPIDCGSANYPILNPVMLYGAYPTRELKHKFHMAERCNAEPLTSQVLPSGLELFPLYGHTMGMVGFKTDDDVCFIADSIVSVEVLKKYTVTYLIDVGQYLETLSFLEGLKGRLYIPSHCKATNDLSDSIALNRQYVEKILSEIKEFCKEPRLTDEVIKHFFDNNELGFNMAQYALIGSTVKSYLSYLQQQEMISMVFSGNMLYWQCV